MSNDNNQDFDSSLFKNKHFKKVALLAVAIVIITFIIAIILNGRNISSIILSDYYFVLGIIILILSVLTRGIAWGVHKKSVLKPHEGNQNDLILAKVKLKLLTKILVFTGIVSMLISIIFMLVYYNM